MARLLKVIQPTELVAPRFSLVSAAGPNPADSEPDQRWENGVTFSPETCSDADAWWECPGVDGAPSADKDTLAVNPDPPAFWPWVVWHSDTCTTLDDWRTRGGRERAIRALEARESKQIAAEFAHGTIVTTGDFPNPWLGDANMVDLSAVPLSVLSALAEMQAALASCSPGRGMIHAPIAVASVWYGLRLIEVDGDRLVDPFGNIIVADAGYDGAAPNGTVTAGEPWIYGTDVVRVWRGKPLITGDPDTAELVYETNSVEWRAERPAMVTFSPCCQLGVAVDLTDVCAFVVPT